MLTSDTIKWVENLAEQELLISSGERVSLDLGRTKEEVMAVATAVFVRQLYSHVQYLVRLFNTQVQDNPSLKIVLSQEVDKLDSFSLTRNRRRLSFSVAKPGYIQIQCERQLVADGASKTTTLFSSVLEGQFALFDEVRWFFLGNSVLPEQMARHYLTEFVQISRDSSSLT